MVVPSTADGYRAAVSALRSIDGEGVSFHTFRLLEDRCARLLMKNLGRGMPESVVREELETLGIHVQGSRSCVPAFVTRTPTRTAPNPTSLYQWREGLRCPTCAQSPKSAACECRWSRTWLQKALCNAGAASALDTRSETAVTRLGASRVVVPTSPVGAQPRGSSLSVVAVGVTTQLTTVAV